MEIANKEYNYNKTYCHVCLSQDRRLFSIGKYANIFYMICEKTLFKMPPSLCWECRAVLKRIKEFIIKCQHSSKILNKITNEQLPFQTLSNLSITNNSSITIGNAVEEKKSDNKNLIADLKKEIVDDNDCTESYENTELKKEIVDDNDCTESYENNDMCSGDIKEESEVETHFREKTTALEEEDKCYNNYSIEKIYKKYTILHEKHCGIDTETLTRKIPVNAFELQSCLNNMRKNDLFKRFKHKCKTCVRSWSSQRELNKHYAKCHDVTAGFTCELCTSRFRTKKKLTVHMSSHLHLLECRLCSFRANPGLMKRHLSTHSRLYQCNQCKIKFSNFYIFSEHYKKLHAEFVCDICGKRTKSRNMIMKHLSYHYESLDCIKCGRNYKNRKSYQSHVEMKHSPSTENCYCVQCDKRFDNAKLYQRHLKSSVAHAAERGGHSTVKKVPCPECGRQYSRKTYMMNHYRYVHENRSKYYCEQCDKSFLNRTRYVEHTKYNHEGVKKAKNKLCNICGKGFAATRTLIHHIRTHSGERPFECEHCGAKFTQKYAMLSHINHIHLKKKRRHCWL